MPRPHPAEIAAEADMERAVRGASHFLASLFRGVGIYDKESAPTVAGAMQAARELEAQAKGTRRCMIYAVGPDSRATLLTGAFIARMIALTKQHHQTRMNESAMNTASKAEQVAALRVKRATAKSNKPAEPKKAVKAKVRTPVKNRSRYDWSAAEQLAADGKIPPALDFSAPTHARFVERLEEIVKAAKAGDIKALKAVKINPVSSSPQALDRYRNLCVKAITAKMV